MDATFDVITLTRGTVPADDREYAEQKLAQLSKVAPRPILKVRLKLTLQEAAHVANPAIVQANIDVADGHIVRTRIEASTLREAADLMLERATRKLRKISDRYVTERRNAGDDKWHRGDAPAADRKWYNRPPEDRELIRRKAIGTSEATPDEAAFDMAMLDYDFFVFTDLETGSGALLYHADDAESLVLRYATGTPDTPSAQASSITRVDGQSAPVIDLDKAIELLDTTGTSFVFFVDEDTNEPSVAYHRYDGHYGLLTARTPG
ncbi:MAG: HPF/RaiA family ribosome-associated protein [Acidimicrobiia bacterium]|nr:HPF/RaiA family ribosome-associated protein [Acidimicrobiia bacterium]